MNAILTVLLGISVRLVIPILATALIVFWLHRLDTKWQAQAEKERELAQKGSTPCWKQEGFSAEESLQRAALSESACWQANRAADGHLMETCLTCEVFRAAPAIDRRARSPMFIHSAVY
ncbi:MAG: hypothetical protein Fur002_13160 [Anaerolineales bacterium]